MKTKLLSVCLLLAALGSKAQSGLTNMSFEAWSTNVIGNAPTGWLGYNMSKQTTGAEDGNNFVRLSSNGGSGTGAILMLGTATSFSNPVKGGAPFTQIPTAITGFYKTSTMSSNDQLNIISYTSKSGTITATASFQQTNNISSWTSFSAPFMVFNNGPVDSIFITVTVGSSSGTVSTTGVADLDNFSLSGTTVTGIDKNALGTAFLVYPNPASGELNILSKDERAVSVMITDISGRVVSETPIETEQTKIDLQQHEAGVYFYTIRDKQKAALFSSRFIIAK